MVKMVKMVHEDIIERLLENEEQGTYISNLAVIYKKWDLKRIKVTLLCQQVNKDNHQTHKPKPKTKELQHKSIESNWFCHWYNKLLSSIWNKNWCLKILWILMTMGTSPASNEIQKHST